MTTVHQLKRQTKRPDLGSTPNVAGSVVAPSLVLIFAVGSIAGLAVSMTYFSYDVWAAFWIAPVLMLLCIPIANHAARAEGDAKIGRFILGAAFLKVVVGASARFGTLEVAYGGGGDSERYHEAGTQLARQFRSLDYADLDKISGTRFIEVLTGQIYVFTGSTEFGGFLVYSFLAFLGMYGFYRAFCAASDGGNRKKYRLLLFLFPTMWFWPSSTGKDAWMIFTLGLACYGLALLIGGKLKGVPLVAFSLWGATIVRPHIVAIFMIAALVAVALRLARRSSPAGAPTLGRAGSLVLLSIVLAVSVIVTAQVQERFGLDELSVESAESVLSETERRSGQGGSEFDAPSPSTPIGYAQSFVTVLFRPFPFEVNNVQAVATSLEGLALALVAYLSLRSLGRLSGALFRTPYIAFAFVYTLGFVYAFASIENFGILARQRSQLLPLLFVLFAIERARPTEQVGPSATLGT